MAGLLAVYARVIQAGPPVYDEFETYNLARLESFAASGATHKVVLLGTSTLKYATLAETGLSRLAAAQGADIAFLRISHNAAQFLDFEPFLDRILASGANLILIQAPLYLKDREIKKNLRVLQQYVAWAVLHGEGTWNPDGIDQHEHQFGTPCNGQVAVANDREWISRVERRVQYRTDGRNALEVREFLSRSEQAGSEVVALAVPQTRKISLALANSEGYRRVIDSVLSDTAAALIYPDAIPDAYFCDHTHLDTPGRELFSAWLTEQIIQRLRGQDSPVSDPERAALNRINSS